MKLNCDYFHWEIRLKHVHEDQMPCFTTFRLPEKQIVMCEKEKNISHLFIYSHVSAILIAKYFKGRRFRI